MFPDNINIRDTVCRDIAAGKKLLEKVAENWLKQTKFEMRCICRL